MSIGFLEVPASAIPNLKPKISLNATLGSISVSATVDVQGASTQRGYPRMAMLAISGDANSNQHYPPVPYSSQVTGHTISSTGFFPNASYDGNPVAWMGRFDYAIIGADWEQADDNGTYDRGLLVDAIHQICDPGAYIPTTVVQYAMLESIYPTTTVAWMTLSQAVAANKWYLYAGPNESGAVVLDGTLSESNQAVAWPNAVGTVAADNSFSTIRTVANYDGLPEDLMQYMAAYMAEKIFARHSVFNDVIDGSIASSQYTDPRFYPNLASGSNHDANKAPNMDGLYFDNSWMYPRFSGYYDLKNNYTGGTWNSTVNPWLVRGYQHIFDRFQKIMARCYTGRTYYNVLNGLNTWISVYLNSPSFFTSASNGMAGYLHGGWLEKVIGASYSIEANQGWDALRRGYYAMMDFCIDPKIIGFAGVLTSSTDYQTARYIMASALMDAGYAAVQIAGNYKVDDAMWPDEAGGNPGTDIPKWWLGQPITSRPTAAAINGVFVRDYQHGVVLVNPKGNGQQTITPAQINNYLGTNYTLTHFTGVQNPSLNNGQVMSSLTMPERDGGFLRH